MRIQKEKRAWGLGDFEMRRTWFLDIVVISKIDTWTERGSYTTSRRHTRRQVRTKTAPRCLNTSLGEVTLPEANQVPWLAASYLL